MKMHILGHNPAVWVVVRVGLQDEFFEDGKEPDHEATTEELKMLRYNTQACDILFNGLCPVEFNKISSLENAKEIWDTLVDMHEVPSPSRNPSWMSFKVNLSGSR